MMNRRPLGNMGIDSSEVALGCWQLGGDWGDVSEAQAMQTLEAAVNAGVNFLDTADVYGSGRSESIIGRFLQSRNENIFVATKLGRLKGYPDGYSFDLFRQCTEDSLKRLRVDALDLTQLHCIPTAALEQGDVFDWLNKLQQQGKIRHWGASVESMDEALICLSQPQCRSLQIIFNIFRQKPATIFEQAKRQGVALIVRLPLASGLLAGTMDKHTSFSPADHRMYNRDGQVFNVGETFAGLKFETGVELADAIKPLVPESMSMAQFALRWILDHDAVSVVIPGAKRPQQAIVNAAASDLPRLSPQIHAQLSRFYAEQVAPQIRGPY